MDRRVPAQERVDDDLQGGSGLRDLIDLAPIHFDFGFGIFNAIDSKRRGGHCNEQQDHEPANSASAFVREFVNQFSSFASSNVQGRNLLRLTIRCNVDPALRSASRRWKAYCDSAALARDPSTATTGLRFFRYCLLSFNIRARRPRCFIRRHFILRGLGCRQGRNMGTSLDGPWKTLDKVSGRSIWHLGTPIFSSPVRSGPSNALGDRTRDRSASTNTGATPSPFPR